MAATYDVSQYLLDRANIQDVVELLYFWYDIGEHDKMRTLVFADKVVMDFTSFWGGEPFTKDGEELAEQWISGIQSQAASAQHIVSSVVPHLPQPGSGEAPKTAKAFANGSTLIKSFKDNVVQNTGRLYVDLIKLGEVPNGNPWRISGLKADVVWHNNTPMPQIAADYEEHQRAKSSES